MMTANILLVMMIIKYIKYLIIIFAFVEEWGGQMIDGLEDLWAEQEYLALHQDDSDEEGFCSGPETEPRH